MSENNLSIPERMLELRTVVVNGEIKPDMIDRVIGQIIDLQLQSSQEIKLIIDSGGGSAHAALKLCDFLEHIITAPVKGVVLGKCHSAATFILLHCNKKVATPHATFLTHSGRLSNVSFTTDDTTEENLELLLKEAKSVKEKVFKMYERKFDKPREEVAKLIARGDQEFDNVIHAEEAKDIGLIDEIVKEKLDIFPT